MVEQEMMEAVEPAKKGEQSEGSGEAPSDKEVSVPFVADLIYGVNGGLINGWRFDNNNNNDHDANNN